MVRQSEPRQSIDGIIDFDGWVLPFSPVCCVCCDYFGWVGCSEIYLRSIILSNSSGTTNNNGRVERKTIVTNRGIIYPKNCDDFEERDVLLRVARPRRLSNKRRVGCLDP